LKLITFYRSKSQSDDHIFPQQEQETMSTYANVASRTIHNSRKAVPSASSKKSVVLASAQQAPRLVADQKETAEVVAPNHNGGVSYDIGKTFDVAVLKKDGATANKCLVALIERMATLGTCDMRCDISATKMTEDARKAFYKFCAYNLDLVVSTIKSVYETDRAPKVSHVIYLIALLTSATDQDAGNAKQAVDLRTKGYTLVPMFRITTHMFEWIHTHITLCSVNGHASDDAKIEEAPGLVVRGRASKSSSKGRKAKKAEPKLERMGGTGAGFRRAVETWYLNLCSTPENAMKLAVQIAKYYNRHNFTHDDVLSLIHIKMTTRVKCACRTKAVCKCPAPKPTELKNVIPVAGQIPLAYAVGGLANATKILLDGVERLSANGGDPERDVDTLCALKVFAFFCAVEKAKKEDTSDDEVCELIRKFRLTREMVSNTKLNSLPVLNALTQKARCTPREIAIAHRAVLLEALPLHTLINTLFADPEDAKEAKIPAEIQIGMPITALVRNINNLTGAGLFSQASNPRAQEMVQAVAKHIADPAVLSAGHVHPINLFNARAVYARGKGFRGDKTWDPVPLLETALLDATEKAFKGLKGLDCSIAFLMDASGSMSQAGSAPGMPCLTALDIGALLIMTFYRALINNAEASGKPIPNYSVGYFGGSGPSRDRNRAVNKMITDRELTERSSSFKDATDKFHPKVTFDDVKKALGNGEHLGMTDVGSAFWSLISRLKGAIDDLKDEVTSLENTTVFQLPGFAELLLLVTDNDVNSGDQPMDVLNLYWDLVRQAFVLLPFDKDGTKTDPATLFSKYVPRLVVVATQGTASTVGDVRDSRILNVSGFDSSAPAVIDAFVRRGESTSAPAEDDEGDDE
ncbi:hypothetical protein YASMINEVIRUS_1038, partial [Yasminevirus sp. GU-2018]